MSDGAAGQMRRAALIAGLVAGLLALAVQLVSDGLYGVLAVSPSVPRALAGDWPFALVARLGLDRVPALRVDLARAALVRGDTARAAALLAPAGDDATVVDLRARVAAASGDPATALRDFARAGDYARARATIDALAQRDPLAALQIVSDFDRRLTASTAPPEITADVEWREGQISAAVAYTHPALAAEYNRRAFAAYGRALVRAPNEETYLLAYADQALVIGLTPAARNAYRRATQVVPDSVDAYAGVAVSSAVGGDCPAARSALAHARTLAAAQHRTIDPAAAAYPIDIRTALLRCGP